MARRNWLLLLLGFKGADGAALDPVRVQKGMFLFAQQSGAPPKECYGFEPYNYGPYSFRLRNDLDRLVAEGLVAAEPVPGYTWRRYKLTAEGMAKAKGLLGKADRDVAKKLFRIKQAVSGKSFNTLLREVYDEYPDFATRSIFRR
jgi:uncharacterized protein YwgA